VLYASILLLHGSLSLPSRYLHFSLFLLILHPPPPPLFPYTTLFRSIRGSQPLSGVNIQTPPKFRNRFCRHAEAGRLPVSAEAREDRKSTRLNSSHQINSYAVFCLKNKMTKSTFVGLHYVHHKVQDGL